MYIYIPYFASHPVASIAIPSCFLIHSRALVPILMLSPQHLERSLSLLGHVFLLAHHHLCTRRLGITIEAIASLTIQTSTSSIGDLERIVKLVLRERKDDTDHRESE